MLKIIKKIYRLIVFRRRIYGEVGKANTFAFGAYIHEMACIGSYNYIGPYTMVNNAIIGNYCSIAPSVKIGQANHSKEFVTTYNKISSKLIEFNMYEKPTMIGNDVWIGANTVIMQGLSIGDGAVIGANTVVTKDVPPYAIVVGVPAKIIKFRFSPESINKIKESKWYQYEFKKAVQIVKDLASEIEEIKND